MTTHTKFVTVRTFSSNKCIQVIKEQWVIGWYWKFNMTKMTRTAMMILRTCSTTNLYMNILLKIYNKRIFFSKHNMIKSKGRVLHFYILHLSLLKRT